MTRKYDKSVVHRKCDYSFIEFIRPETFWPQPYSVEQAFGVFRWMIQTGKGHEDRTKWGSQSVRSLLSGQPTCVNFSEVDPIISIDDLRRRFHFAILCGGLGKNLQKWREKFNITPVGSAIISFPHGRVGENDESEHEIKKGLSALLSASGQLKTQLNEFHARARTILGVRLRCWETWVFELQYGYDGSVWRYDLARQVRGERFLNTFRRAKNKLADLAEGSNN